MSRLWDKGVELDERILRYTAGEDHHLDDRLIRYDVQASIAHARMLAANGLLEARDLDAIEEGLEALGSAHAAGDWRVELADEDGHTALERRLTQRIGEAGARVHLGRSRNDQVLAALRLYMLDACAQLSSAADAVASALRALARREPDVPLPGYTHMQRAMPSSVALWAEGFAAEIADDAEGLAGARRRASKNPLGSAAGYGVPVIPVDREHTRRELGFEQTHAPVTAVQLSRGKAEAQLLFECHLLMQDLGRLAADLVLFATAEFGFVQLPEEMTTGSSIMPQKRNPDVFELVRGRSATSLACLVEALSVTSRLPSGYHRDLQLLKAPLFRGIDTALETAAIMAHALDGVHFERDRIRLDDELQATAIAYRMVLDEGIPFREAYRRTAAQLAEK